VLVLPNYKLHKVRRVRPTLRSRPVNSYLFPIEVLNTKEKVSPNKGKRPIIDQPTGVVHKSSVTIDAKKNREIQIKNPLPPEQT
jgi:hypothetical protein